MSTGVVLLFALFSATPQPGSLSGQVTDETGAPLAGAIVSLYTARPRVGIPTTCPSCYRDCAKSTKTDPDGRFTIGELDPILLFRVLVMAPRRRGTVTQLIDPAETNLEVELQPLPTNVPNDRMLRGRVVDEQGKPIAGAVVSPAGAKTAGKDWFGQTKGVDEAAVADAEGRFVLTSETPLLGLRLRAEARGYAVLSSRQLYGLDGREHEIRLRRGANVTGRLVYENRPVTDRALGIVQRDRSAGNFVGETTLASDAQGAFAFYNLQPNQRYVLYSICNATSDRRVLKTVSLETRDDDQVTDLGELSLVDGLILSGRVELPNSVEMPANAKLRVSRDPAWDWCEVPLGADGAFEVGGLPPEVYAIKAVVPGFEIDASRMRFQLTGPSDFGVGLRSDRRNVVVPMMPKRP